MSRARSPLIPAFLLCALASAAAVPPSASSSRSAPPSSRAESYYLYCLFQQSLLHSDYGSALTYLEEAARADPNASLLALELSRVYLTMNEIDRAMKEASRAALLDPSSVEARRTLVEIYRALVSRDENRDDDLFTRAVAAHAQLLALDPAAGETRLSLARLYLSRGLFMQTAEILKAHLASDPDSLEGTYLLSQALLRSGARDEAKALLEAAIARRPGNPDLRGALAEALEAGGDFASAETTLRDLAQSFPGRPGYRFALARLYLKMKRYDDAATEGSALVRGLQESADGPERADELRAAHLLLIEAWFSSGKMDQALAAARRAELDFPQEPRFPLMRAEILLEDGRDQEAWEIFAMVTSRSGGDPAGPRGVSEAYLRAAARRERKEDFPRAEALLRRALEAEPGNHAAMNYLGYMMAERGVNLEESLVLIEKAVALDADNGAYLDSLGWALFRLGRYTQAEEPLSRAAHMIPEEPVVHDHLGELYWAQGRHAEAVGAWEEALRLGSEDAAAIREKISRAGGSLPR